MTRRKDVEVVDKRMGRPPADDPTVPVRIGKQVLADVDAWRGEQQSRQEALAEAVARWVQWKARTR